MCSRTPLPRAPNYVTGEVDTQNRYIYCSIKNRHGDCHDYEEAPEPIMREPHTLYEPEKEPL